MSQEQDRVYIDRQDPGAYQALVAVATQVTASAAAAGLDRRLVELVNLRVSQLNRCAFCLDLHTARALKAGETQHRLAVLPAWRDSELYSRQERAALTLAEDLTLLRSDADGDPERLAARADLTAEQVSALSWVVVAMNAFNRVSIASGHGPRGPRSA